MKPRTDIHQTVIIAMQVALKVLLRMKAQPIVKSTMRLPTKKEIAKHQKLVAKQRRKSMGEQ